MSTRTGDIAPRVLTFLAAREGHSPAAMEKLVSRQSGLLGLSEVSSDTRELLEKEATDQGAAEALAVFVHQARKAIGACTATLGGLDAIVFSGGIGENSVALRARLCAHFEYLDLILDPALNAASAPIISDAASRVTVYVIPADEESALATAARSFLTGATSPLRACSSARVTSASATTTRSRSRSSTCSSSSRSTRALSAPACSAAGSAGPCSFSRTLSTWRK